MTMSENVNSSSEQQQHHLVILYGSVGGLSDVGRHAVQACLEIPNTSCTVLTEQPELLEEKNWNCGCTEPHGTFSESDKQRMKIVRINSWNVDEEDLAQYFESNTVGVVSCVGNRQPFIGGWDASAATSKVIKAMKEKKVQRLVVMSSAGVEEDWPPLEWSWTGKILAFMFLTISRKAFRDLSAMERTVRASADDDDGINYLLVRPVGIGEDVVPCGKWKIQKEKYKDPSLYFNMAKLDVARYMVQETIRPTRNKDAVTIGA